jgi:hypothetical protein
LRPVRTQARCRPELGRGVGFERGGLTPCPHCRSLKRSASARASQRPRCFGVSVRYLVSFLRFSSFWFVHPFWLQSRPVRGRQRHPRQPITSVITRGRGRGGRQGVTRDPLGVTNRWVPDSDLWHCLKSHSCPHSRWPCAPVRVKPMRIKSKSWKLPLRTQFPSPATSRDLDGPYCESFVLSMGGASMRRCVLHARSVDFFLECQRQDPLLRGPLLDTRGFVLVLAKDETIPLARLSMLCRWATSDFATVGPATSKHRATPRSRHTQLASLPSPLSISSDHSHRCPTFRCFPDGAAESIIFSRRGACIFSFPDEVLLFFHFPTRCFYFFIS